MKSFELVFLICLLPLFSVAQKPGFSDSTAALLKSYSMLKDATGTLKSEQEALRRRLLDLSDQSGFMDDSLLHQIHAASLDLASLSRGTDSLSSRVQDYREEYLAALNLLGKENARVKRELTVISVIAALLLAGIFAFFFVRSAILEDKLVRLISDNALESEMQIHKLSRKWRSNFQKFRKSRAGKKKKK